MAENMDHPSVSTVLGAACAPKNDHVLQPGTLDRKVGVSRSQESKGLIDVQPVRGMQSSLELGPGFCSLMSLLPHVSSLQVDDIENGLY